MLFPESLMGLLEPRGDEFAGLGFNLFLTGNIIVKKLTWIVSFIQAKNKQYSERYLLTLLNQISAKKNPNSTCPIYVQVSKFSNLTFIENMLNVFPRVDNHFVVDLLLSTYIIHKILIDKLVTITQEENI